MFLCSLAWRSGPGSPRRRSPVVVFEQLAKGPERGGRFGWRALAAGLVAVRAARRTQPAALLTAQPLQRHRQEERLPDHLAEVQLVAVVVRDHHVPIGARDLVLFLSFLVGAPAETEEVQVLLHGQDEGLQAPAALQGEAGGQLSPHVDGLVLAALEPAVQAAALGEGEAVLPFEVDLPRLQALVALEPFRREPGDVDDQHPPLAQTLYATDPSGIVKIEVRERRETFQPRSLTSMVLETCRTPGMAATVSTARRAEAMLALPESRTTPLSTESRWMSSKRLSALNVLSIRSLISLSLAFTTSFRDLGTTWSMFLTSRTPSILRTTSSARAFSASVSTLPCRVTTPPLTSTLTSLAGTLSAVRR